MLRGVIMLVIPPSVAVPLIINRGYIISGSHGSVVERELLLANGALLAPCRRWIGKCKWARPQNEQHQLVLRLIETRILSA